MRFSESVSTCLKAKYATFKGRASRSEYWWFYLASVVLQLAVWGPVAYLTIAAMSASEQSNSTLVTVLTIVGAIVSLGLVIPMLAVSVRRLHDRNLSGWWYLAFIVATMLPYVGLLASVALVVVCCLKGTQGPNRFGADPLAASYSAEVFA